MTTRTTGRRRRPRPADRTPTAALVIALVLSAATLAGCDTDRRAISRDDLPVVPDEADAVVTVGRGGFDTDGLAVDTDDWIEFVARVETRITATSEAVTFIDTGVLLAGESTLVVLDVAGTYEFRTDTDDLLTIVSSER